MRLQLNLMSKYAVFNLAFRPFFLCAGIFAVVSMLLWMAIYLTSANLPGTTISASQWHAHEMIYGYSLAVISGFLLTAVKNWTGIQTVNGTPLLLLVLLWLIARVALFCGFIVVAAIFDLVFLASMMTAVSIPIIQAKQWRQLAILFKLLTLFVCNLLFYMAVFDKFDNGIYWGIYGGLYLVIGLILMISRRVLPMFIERGVDQSVSLSNAKWLDLSSLFLFLAFFISEMFFSSQTASSVLALLLFIVNAIRLAGWYTPGIWRKPLLWSLYLSLSSICVGFLLFFAIQFFAVPKFISIHAFAYGGIGAITLAMMSRVTLGHTGRDISQPPSLISSAFAMLVFGTIVRVLIPLLAPDHYLLWIGLSQIVWIAAFTIFCYLYLPILLAPRVDGKFG